jgi:hypothetical protein
MKVKIKSQLIYDEVYDMRIRIYAGMSEIQFAKKVIKDENLKVSTNHFDMDNDLVVYSCTYADFPGGHRNLIILYSKHSSIPGSYLVHELTHIKSRVFEFRAVRYWAGNDEHEANYQEFLFRKISGEKI